MKELREQFEEETGTSIKAYPMMYANWLEKKITHTVDKELTYGYNDHLIGKNTPKRVDKGVSGWTDNLIEFTKYDGEEEYIATLKNVKGVIVQARTKDLCVKEILTSATIMLRHYQKPTPKPQEECKCYYQEWIEKDDGLHCPDCDKLMLDTTEPQEEKMYSLNDIKKWVSEYTTIEEFLHYVTPKEDKPLKHIFGDPLKELDDISNSIKPQERVKEVILKHLPFMGEYPDLECIVDKIATELSKDK